MRAQSAIGDRSTAVMQNKVRTYLERQLMAKWREPLWVAVSGGVDSMVLLHVLIALRHPVSVVHVDHGLRGAESDADHQFVKQVCEKLKVPFKGVKVDVKALAIERNLSTQMAARDLRYELFRELTSKGPSKLALAHHQDDAIETLFMQMMQGMGLNGWRTIPPVSGPFIRPLMVVSRAEIMAYAEEHGIAYRADASNADRKYMRNRVRHELLPILESWRPGVRRSLSRSVDLFREMDHVMRKHLQDLLADHMNVDGVQQIPSATILEHGAPRSVLYYLLRSKGFHPDRMDDILVALQEKKTGATFSDGEYRITVDREVLIIEKISESAPRNWMIDSFDDLPEDLPLRITLAGSDQVDLTTGHTTAWLDRDRSTLPLEFRPWKPGDRMRPIGMKGSKLISDLLIDAKVPRNEKERVYVLVDHGKIVWLAGFRVAAGFEAGPGTRNVVRIDLIGKPGLTGK